MDNTKEAKNKEKIIESMKGLDKRREERRKALAASLRVKPSSLPGPMGIQQYNSLLSNDEGNKDISGEEIIVWEYAKEFYEKHGYFDI